MLAELPSSIPPGELSAVIPLRVVLARESRFSQKNSLPIPLCGLRDLCAMLLFLRGVSHGAHAVLSERLKRVADSDQHPLSGRIDIRAGSVRALRTRSSPHYRC